MNNYDSKELKRQIAKIEKVIENRATTHIQLKGADAQIANLRRIEQLQSIKSELEFDLQAAEVMDEMSA